MAIRVECPHEGWEEIWIDYREDHWTFGDRHRMNEAARVSDFEMLELLLDYIEDWNMIDVDGNQVELDKEKGAELFFNLDDVFVVTWVVSSWFEARLKRGEVPKNS